MKKRAILQVADTGPLESLVLMLESAGYECLLPGERLRNWMREIGMDCVLDVEDLIHWMGYSRPLCKLQEADLSTMKFANVGKDAVPTILVDVKAHRSYSKIVKEWPNFAGRVLWYRINGGKPEHVVKDLGGGAKYDAGDEVNPPCPVLTPNQWYGNGLVETTPVERTEGFKTKQPCPSYTCWPPFLRFNNMQDKYPRITGQYTPPICLIHNIEGWGYRDLMPSLQEIGVGMYGRGSPNGCMTWEESMKRLSKSIAMVHLKSSDAPGYALYEALTLGVPVICTRRLIWRCRMQDLLIPGVTCLTFDRETHDGLTPEDVRNCVAEVRHHLDYLYAPETNRKIGEAGRNRLREIMWSETRESDVESLKKFMATHFGA